MEIGEDQGADMGGSDEEEEQEDSDEDEPVPDKGDNTQVIETNYS